MASIGPAWGGGKGRGQQEAELGLGLVCEAVARVGEVEWAVLEKVLVGRRVGPRDQGEVVVGWLGL